MFQFRMEYLILLCAGIIAATTVDNVWCITNDALPVNDSIYIGGEQSAITERTEKVEG